MSCNNCFNGCLSTVSDKCVKYTGISIPALNISNGDTLSSVETSITTYLLSAISGEGIAPIIDPLSLCDLVTSFLPDSGNITLNNVIDALIKSICSLQEQVTDNTNSLNTLNADYTISCLSGVINSSDTHLVLQATINKLCSLSSEVTALALDLETNYVSVDTIDGYIAAYLASIGASTLVSAKMVPYSILPFYGDLTGKFDATGAGLGDWDKIYLCNGNNATPDLRGRVPVGITNMLGGSFPAQTQPGINSNPDYSTKGITTGTNQVTLSSAQIPSHTHTATILSAGTHTHNIKYSSTGSGTLYPETPYTSDILAGTGGETTPNGDHTHTITINPAGENLAHLNIQPVLSVYYIIYIP